jgi:hypothetical protein
MQPRRWHWVGLTLLAVAVAVVAPWAPLGPVAVWVDPRPGQSDKPSPSIDPLADPPLVFDPRDKAVVSLRLSRVSAERLTHEILFDCDVILDNTTGKDLIVQSNFSSALDGLNLVVTRPDGTVLAQQGHTDHLSPVALGQTFPLKQGRTEETLLFPVRDVPAGVRTLKVRLVGTLPGSEYRRILSTDTLEVTVE